MARDVFPGASGWVPDDGDLNELAKAVHDCRGCDLYQDSTQAVFGDGPPDAPLVVVGEQPGDVEDTEGEPFVGPAGRLLDRALGEAGIDRSAVYVTNAVKHFRYTREGKRRIHKTPAASHIVACSPWLNAELSRIRPQVVVVLGSVAAKALLGSSFRVTQHRGERVELPDGTAAVPTVHPSSVLRSTERKRDFGLLVDDLRVAVSLLR